jgi:hypothetical protein
VTPGYSVKGDLSRDGAMVQGWCWSPDRPEERLSVALVMDGRQVAAGVAARLRLDLVRDGVCDGYHAFVFALQASSFGVLEARELGTGAAFGRILGNAATDLAGWMTRLDALDRALTAMARAVAAPTVAPLSTALAYAGTQFARLSAPLCLLPGLRLPAVPVPQLSLLLDLETAPQDVLAAVAALAPHMQRLAAELVVVDRGTWPASAVFASLPGLSYCLTSSATRVDRLNAGLAQARGTSIALLDPASSSLWPGLRALGQCEDVWAGAAVASVARRAGFAAFASPAMAPLGGCVLLQAPRAVFTQLEGLDPVMDDGGYLPELDFTLRAQLAGYSILLTDNALSALPPPSRSAARAREIFNLRWGIA